MSFPLALFVASSITVAVAQDTPAEGTADAEVPTTESSSAPSNADFNASITHADGSTTSGHVRMLERGIDWYADKGWTDEDRKLTISAESGSEARDIPWTEVKSITIKKGSTSSDIDCFYDSDFSPWMYDCTLKTTGTVVTTDGKSWTVDGRHKWRFTFDDGKSIEFWIKKHPAREQTEQVVTLDTTNPENYDLYTTLQERLRQEATTTLVVKIVVN